MYILYQYITLIVLFNINICITLFDVVYMYVLVLLYFCCSHVFNHVMDALVHVAAHLTGEELRLDFLQHVLQSFVQQGIDGKRALDRKEALSALKISSSSFSLGLLLPVIATVREI